MVTKAYTYAGRWAPGTFVTGAAGGQLLPAAGAAVAVALVGGGNAAAYCWTDRTKSVNASCNPTLDANGNLAAMFFDPGDYQYSVTPVGGSASGPFTFHVDEDAAEPSVIEGDLVVGGGVATAPGASSTTNISTGTPYHNTSGYDQWVTTPVTITASSALPR